MLTLEDTYFSMAEKWNSSGGHQNCLVICDRGNFYLKTHLAIFVALFDKRCSLMHLLISLYKFSRNDGRLRIYIS